MHYFYFLKGLTSHNDNFAYERSLVVLESEISKSLTPPNDLLRQKCNFIFEKTYQ